MRQQAKELTDAWTILHEVRVRAAVIKHSVATKPHSAVEKRALQVAQRILEVLAEDIEKDLKHERRSTH